MIRDFVQSILFAYWDSQARYLAGRLTELENEERHLRVAKREAADRLRKASARLVQYGRLA